MAAPDHVRPPVPPPPGGPPPGRRPRRRTGLAAAVVGPVAVLVAACGTSSPTASGTSTTGASTTAAPTTTAAAAGGTSTSAPGGSTPFYEVKTGQVKGLGTVLVDGQGMTLYMFEPDKQSGQSTCYGTCAQGWPPLILPVGVSAPVAGPGVQASLLGTTHRTDGQTELTYDKWPLYTWVNDSQPGQATGQGLNNLGGLWYVLSPSGQVVKTKPAP
ncbi:MAG TPA: hypothetical protein VMB72_00255 [Acidimicrobiales bacterium]|nr:hypothetical protein [Acidimicrobiales bacterium]